MAVIRHSKRRKDVRSYLSRHARTEIKREAPDQPFLWRWEKQFNASV